MTTCRLVVVLIAVLAFPSEGEAQSTPPAPQAPAAQPGDHSQHAPPGAQLPPFVPPVTDADRQAAFPDVEAHAAHDNAIRAFVLFDQFEWQGGGEHRGVALDAKGWVGGDLDRLWFRAEADRTAGRVEDAQAHLLYGRAVARWWDIVAGLRQDTRPGPGRTWAAVGIQGLAPYWFEVEATAYIGAGGRTHARVEAEYELLLTNRLVLQPLVELEIYGKADPVRGIGAGLSRTETGARLRYEIRREFAPYVGITWDRRYFGTAAAARAAGEEVAGARLVVGLRFWR